MQVINKKKKLFANYFLVLSLPKPRLPRFDVIVDCFPYAIGITAVTVAVHISMAKMLAKRMKYHVDPNQV